MEKLSKPIIRQPKRVLMTIEMVGYGRQNDYDEPIRPVYMFWDEKTLEYIGYIDPYIADKDNNEEK